MSRSERNSILLHVVHVFARTSHIVRRQSTMHGMLEIFREYVRNIVESQGARLRLSSIMLFHIYIYVVLLYVIYCLMSLREQKKT